MKSQSIVLIRPPQPYLYVDTHYPIGLALVGTKLQKAGHKANGMAVNSVRDAKIPYAGWYLITSTTPSYLMALSLAKRIKKEYPMAHLVVGGPHASALPEEVWADDVWHYVVVGEADDLIVSIVHQELNEGIVRCSPPEDIDEIPSRSLFPPPSLRVGNRPAANVILTRGCPNHCRFCASGGVRYRRRSEESIRTEIEMLKKDGYSGVVLNDDMPILNDTQLESICRVMSQVGVLFRMNLCAEQVTEQRVQLLKKSGCVQVNIGVEMPSNRILRKIEKRASVEDMARAFDILNQYNLPSKALLIHGLPGTGYEEAQTLVEFVKRVRPTYVTITSFFPMPGSPYFAQMREELAMMGISVYDFLYHGKDGNSKHVTHLPNGVLTSHELDRLKVQIWNAIQLLGITQIDRGEISKFS